MHACMYVGTYTYTDTMVNIKILASSGASFSVPIPHSLNPQAQSLNPQNICTHAHRHTHTHTHTQTHTNTHKHTRARTHTHTHSCTHTHAQVDQARTLRNTPRQKVFSYYKRCSLTIKGVLLLQVDLARTLRNTARQSIEYLQKEFRLQDNSVYRDVPTMSAATKAKLNAIAQDTGDIVYMHIHVIYMYKQCVYVCVCMYLIMYIPRPSSPLSLKTQVILYRCIYM